MAEEFVNNYVVLDIETTGFDSYNDSIIEISAVKVVNKEIVEVFSHLILIDFPLSAFTTNLTGITNENIWTEGRPINEVLEKLIKFVGNDVIVGHCIRFDLGFINANLEKLFDLSITNISIDTCALAKKFYRNVLNHKLETLAKAVNTTYFPSHRALNDCLATYELYEGMRKINERKQ